MSSLAQEESRSISENCTWGQRKRFADGKVTVPFGRFLGYDRGEDGNLVVNPEQAKLVRRIYGLFLTGMSPTLIARTLTNEGIPTPSGKEKWYATSIKSILTNEKYKGDALLQKSYTTDFLTKKTKKNEGEIPQYYVKGNHEAIVSSVLNILLDILLVVVIPMGVAGAALATVIAQVISGALCLIYAFRILPVLRMKRADMRLNPEIARKILIYGIPTGLQMSIISISDMTLQGKINTYSTVLVVAYGICIKVEIVGWQIAEAIGSAVGTFVGQNIGAGRYDRVRQGVRCAYLINFICYGVFCPVIWLCAEPIMRLFTQSPESIRYGVEYMRIFSFFFMIGGTMTIFHNILRPAGDVAVTLAMGVSEVITRITLTFLLTALFGYYGLWWVSPITWVCAVGVGAARYYSGKWEVIARRNQAA